MAFVLPRAPQPLPSPFSFRVIEFSLGAGTRPLFPQNESNGGLDDSEPIDLTSGPALAIDRAVAGHFPGSVSMPGSLDYPPDLLTYPSLNLPCSSKPFLSEGFYPA